MNYPIVNTERLFARVLHLDDVDLIYKHFSNQEVTRYMDIDVCKERAEAEEIITFHMSDPGCRYGLFLKDTGEFIGTCGYHCWMLDANGSRAEIGFDLHPNYWGQGYMKEALNEIVKIGFELMELDLIEATTEQENKQCQRLLNKVGFIKEEVLKENLMYYRLNKKTI
ncbi:GNAT family N-acetyltransferase [Paenibacillus sp. MDMC362]|uniref:GNAT family N-acetyltransferase n=1 Tax=Paenibacillus sp. MDMC362 TaxID=2977365 RepID=UPI0021A458DA|nr:GNAT family N-acetyltransferase [Paenibacillus sp. MDMC362]